VVFLFSWVLNYHILIVSTFQVRVGNYPVGWRKSSIMPLNSEALWWPISQGADLLYLFPSCHCASCASFLLSSLPFIFVFRKMMEVGGKAEVRRVGGGTLNSDLFLELGFLGRLWEFFRLCVHSIILVHFPGCLGPSWLCHHCLSLQFAHLSRAACCFFIPLFSSPSLPLVLSLRLFWIPRGYSDLIFKRPFSFHFCFLSE
jgi:hypothetical protein